MTLNSFFNFFIFIGCITVSSAQTPNETKQNYTPDKVEFHKVVGDSLELILEDYVRSMELDSVWRTQLADQMYSKRMETIIKDSLTAEAVVTELPTELLKERLAVLNSKTPFNIEYNESLESVIGYFLKREKQGTERLMGLSKFYFPMFEATFDKYDIPLEMKYLALVESALNPRAKSRVGATGLWQFMYPTGKMYDLDVSSYVDERMDPIKSTRAACEYMSYLYKIYGKWDLVLAAYNCGPGNVNKAMRRAGTKTGNYWDLYPYLPRETRGYVPAFIAVNYWMNHPEDHNIYPIEPRIEFFDFDTVHVKQPIAMDALAQQLDIDVEDLVYLNPTFKEKYVPVYSNKTTILALPHDKVGAFVSNDSVLYALNKVELEKENKGTTVKKFSEDRITYRVQSGDYLGKIAARHHVSVSSLKRWNGLRSNNIRVGQRLVIYPNGNYASTTTPKTSKPKIYTTSGKMVYYNVQSGDTLWDIAKNRGMSVSELQQLNSNLDSRSLKPGMKIIVGTNG